jgi:hypothetical protein
MTLSLTSIMLIPHSSNADVNKLLIALISGGVQ